MKEWVWLILAILVPALTIALVILRRSPKDDLAIRSSFTASDTRLKGRFESLPRRWFHNVAPVLLLIMPFAQWFGYFHTLNILALLLPLGLVCGVNIIIGAYAPAVRDLKIPPLRNQLLNLIAAIVLLATTFAPQPTGLILLFRWIMIDVVALMMAAFIMRLLAQRHDNRVDA